MIHPENISADISDAERARIKFVGEVTQELAPSYANAIAGVILGLLALGGGGFILTLPIRGAINAGGKLPFYAEHGWCWIAVILMPVPSLLLMAIGVWLLRLSLSITRLRVFICEQGICCADGKSVKVFPWNEVTSIEEKVIHEHLPIVKGPLRYAMPTKTTRSYKICREDGEKCLCAPGNVENFSVLEQLIRDQAKQRNIAWSTTEETA